MVEIYAHRDASLSFVMVQNWSRNINKRGVAEANASIEWLEGSIGSHCTVTYPSTMLRGRGASTTSIVVGVANGPYIKDTGSKVIHTAPAHAARYYRRA